MNLFSIIFRVCNSFMFFSLRFSIFKAENVHRSVFPNHASDGSINYRSFIDLNDSTFSFSRFCNVDAIDVERLAHAGLIFL